ncbi:12833_t:CDS:2 [Funneliformis mosseae]|uniref:12833_t:CDS:1 n=1 Tax=Funneliformis mosseae TaxID=27381 RepID=A0A9N9FJK4_FUNMO|nr:12833_t:CDS:2 [Funneliformis mosseae]
MRAHKPYNLLKVFSNSSYNFTKLKQEIIRLKAQEQELALQVGNEKRS